MEKLYELHDEHRLRPRRRRHAADPQRPRLPRGPRRLTRFLDHRLYRVLMAPTRGIVRAVNVAAQAFLRTVSQGRRRRRRARRHRLLLGVRRHGAGFRDRAASTLELLSDDVTAFVLVAAPRRDVVDEATYFAARLHEADIPVRALIVNRMHPRFSNGVARRHARAGRPASPAPTWAGSTPTWPTSSRWPRTRRRTWPAWPSGSRRPRSCGCRSCSRDVHDLDGLAEIGRHLFGT